MKKRIFLKNTRYISSLITQHSFRLTNHPFMNIFYGKQFRCFTSTTHFNERENA